MRGALPKTPAFCAHGDYTLTFASQSDLAAAKPEFGFQTTYAIRYQRVPGRRPQEPGIAPDIACSIVIYLAGRAWDGFMASKNLLATPTRRSAVASDTD